MDICHLSSDKTDRPSNKSEAMTEEVMGSTMVGTAGTVAATQIGLNEII
jgi:hypothetical protein